MKKIKVALLTNMIAPYRIPLYSVLAEQFDLMVLHGGKEANRDSWDGIEKALRSARIVRAFGWQIRHKKKLEGNDFDEKFIHMTPGFAWHLLRFRPDIVISNEMGFRSIIALAYGAAFRRPVWIWWGGTLHSERSIGPLRKIVRKAVSWWADNWISYGQTSTEYLLSLGVKRNRILQTQNAVDEARFQATVEPVWAIQPKPVLLYVGQFIERKGVGALLEAAAKVQQEGYCFSLLLIGSGAGKEALKQRAAKLALRNVHFCSAEPPEKMPSVYRSADVLVLPTLEDVWGLVVNEAILSGIPVLCSKYAGCAPELLAQENIFAPEDMNDFCQKLRMAIAGKLSKTDLGRLKSTEQLGCQLVEQLNASLPTATSNRQLRSES